MNLRGHVIIATYDSIAQGLAEKLRLHRIPYVAIEPDPAVAARLHGEGVSVVTGDADSRSTYERLQAARARLVLANCSDTENTNITLTVREIGPEVPILSIVENEDSVDILELSGSTYVLPLKHRLGEYLAARVGAGRAAAHVVGRFRDLQLVELPVRHTQLAGLTVRDTRLRQTAGLNIVGVWERGRLLPAHPDTALLDSSVIVIAGTADQISALNRLLMTTEPNRHPVLVIGAGNVGWAAARALRSKGVPVHLIERDASARERVGTGVDELFIGDAADRQVLERAGLAKAPSVLLSTNDDAMNIYLAVYCRRLNPRIRIVSRITLERNVEAIHRAGADFVLSYTSLGVEAAFSLLQGREVVLLGEGVDLFEIPLPSSLSGRTLSETGIGARTGLTVVAVHHGDEFITNPPASLRLVRGSTLLALGSTQQRQAFSETFR